MNVIGNYTINMRYDPRVLELVEVEYTTDPGKKHKGFQLRLSKKDNNGLQFDNEGHLIAIPKTSEDAGYAVYYPGNGIQSNPDLNAYDPIQTIRCNSSVSRVKSGDPLPSNEGVNTFDLVQEILHRLESEQT